MTVVCRGIRCRVLTSEPVTIGSEPGWRLRVQAEDDGPLRGEQWPVLFPLEPVEPHAPPELSLNRVGRDARWTLLHDAFHLTLAPPTTSLAAASNLNIDFWPYQYIPALRMLSLPRARILNASDVGLGKTIETGLCLRELIARRRANRILILCPASITEQWRDEMETRFGLEFKVFDREGVDTSQSALERDTSPWAVEPRIISSFDYLKRREGAFREVQNLRFDVIICDEAHHLAQNVAEEDGDISDRHRLAVWASQASDSLLLLTATPHSGYDNSLASLLRLLEPSLVPDPTRLQRRIYDRYMIRHLKRHIVKPDGAPLFIPPEKSSPLPVRLSGAEQAVHDAVADQAGELDAQAEKVKSTRDRFALRLVATILRKRASSSLAALRNTVQSRLANLDRAEQAIEIRRDHLRALRRGDSIPDDDLRELEQDAHRSYLSQIRSAGRALRTIEQERTDLHDLQSLLTKCPLETESKAQALLAEFKRIHAAEPSEKIIVFSEYADTVEWLAAFLRRNGYSKIVEFSGSLTPRERAQTLSAFVDGDPLILLTTDAASEGLNLQHNCRRVIHYELPFNPNRMLQRQGRVDRFGQKRPCCFGYLYAADTYEGEVLHRLFEKIERQVLAIGAIGDILGALQAAVIEDLVSRSPSNVKTALADADRTIEQELARLNDASRKELLGNDGIPKTELSTVEAAIKESTTSRVERDRFLLRAIRLADGQASLEQGVLTVQTVPRYWVGGKVKSAYDAIYVNPAKAPRGVTAQQILHDQHPLLLAAIRWVRQSRFQVETDGADHRLAVRVMGDLTTPDVIATFLVTLRSADHMETERLMSVRVDSKLQVQPADAGWLLRGESVENAPTAVIERLFGPWWQRARELAAVEAEKRASEWLNTIRNKRQGELAGLTAQLDDWNKATVASIIHGHDMSPTLFADKPRLPPAVERRRREHQQQFERQQRFIRQRVVFDSPAVEPLGVLLRLPKTEAS